MTQIVVHPVITTARRVGSPMLLTPPWSWWHTRAYRSEERDALIMQTYTGDLTKAFHSADDVFTATFGRDWDSVVLTDPPSMRLTTVQEYPEQVWGDPLLRTACLPPREYAEAQVVWHERPGPDWEPVTDPRRTCRPGDYRVDAHAGDRHDLRRLLDRDRDLDRSDRGWVLGDPQEYTLDWPLDATIRDGQPQPLPPAPRRGEYQCVHCQRYMSVPETIRSLQLRGGLLCEQCAYTNIWAPLQAPPRQFPREGGGRRSAVVFTIPGTGTGMAPPLTAQGAVRGEGRGGSGGAGTTGSSAGGYGPINEEHCEVCGGPWHGLTGDGHSETVIEGTDGAESYRQVGNGGAKGCPGAFADDDEIAAWHAQHGH